jgi:hypothetical protein
VKVDHPHLLLSKKFSKIIIDSLEIRLKLRMACKKLNAVEDYFRILKAIHPTALEHRIWAEDQALVKKL